MSATASGLWYARPNLNIQVSPTVGFAPPGSPTWAPICMFPEHIAALDVLNDRQFRWTLRLLATCFLPPQPNELERPQGSIPMTRYEDLWRIAGAESLQVWLAECRPVLDLFTATSDGHYVVPAPGLIAATVVTRVDEGRASDREEKPVKLQ